MAKSRQLTPAQLARIAELKNKSKPAPVVAPDPVLATQDDIETFLAEEFPDPVPAAPEPVVSLTVDAGVSDMTVPYDMPVTQEPETPVAVEPDKDDSEVINQSLMIINPDVAFRAWLRTPQGLNASDPRLPEDPVRRASELEDALLLAFRAGFNLTNAASV